MKKGFIRKKKTGTRRKNRRRNQDSFLKREEMKEKQREKNGRINERKKN